MYINKIDDLIDKILDDFYKTVIMKNKDFVKIIKESNFVKFQPEINKILIEYVSEISEKEIYDIVQNQDNVVVIIEIIKKYISYYFFLTIGFFYSGKQDTFINNIIEISRNQPTFQFKVENFFNSENNSNVIKFFAMIHNTLNLLTAESSKLALLTKKIEYLETINFLNDLGQDVVFTNFKLENIGGNKNTQAHNIIKLLILNELYIKQDKKDVYLIIESAEKEKGIYTFIDIVLPKTDTVDFAAIEALLSVEDAEKGLAYDIYELLIHYEKVMSEKNITVDDKVLTLINNNILTPISDDFLLYHKDTEKYDKQSYDSTKKKKEDTRLRYIVSKIDSVSDYYSESVKRNSELKKSIEKHFYLPMFDRKVILVNEFEELKILTKLTNQGYRSIENNEFYNDLMTFRSYPYINFKEIQNHGFTLTTNKTVDVLRYVNVEKTTNLSNKYLQLRVGSKDQHINIVGFLIKPTVNVLQCLKIKDLYSIRNIGYIGSNSKKTYTNGYEGILQIIKHVLFKNKKLRQAIYWIFNPETDKIQLTKYEQLTKLTGQENMKLIVSKLYDDLVHMIYLKIIEKINKYDTISLYQFKQIVKSINKRIFDLPKDSELFNTLERYVYEEKYIKSSDSYDKNDDIFTGVSGKEVIKLPSAPTKQKSKIPVLITKIFEEEKKIETVELDDIDTNAICQHNITWENISAIRKKNPGEFTDKLYEFVADYVLINYEEDYVCKSCGGLIDIKNHVIDGSYDDDGKFVVFSMPLTIPIDEMPEYEKYKITIKNIDKLFDKVSTVGKIQFLMDKSSRNKNQIKLKLIKNTVDLLLTQNTLLREKYKERLEKINQMYGIPKEITNFFVFELDNSIFVYSSKDKDYYKTIKRNNILMYIVFMIILEFNDSQIIYLIGDKTCNYFMFTHAYQLFENLKIRKNNQNVTAPIQNYKVLCYLIYYISCLLTKYRIWQYDTEDDQKETNKKSFSTEIQKKIIYTLIDLINSVLEIYSSKKMKNNYIYEMLSVKFFQKLGTTYKNNDILKKIKEIEEKKLVVDGNKKRLVKSSIKPILIEHIFSNIPDYLGVPNWRVCKAYRTRLPPNLEKFDEYYNINNITNCEIGSFHKWKYIDNNMECTICHKKLANLKMDNSDSKKSKENYNYILIKKYAEKYCPTGALHKLIYDENKKCTHCSKCSFTNIDKFTNKELDEIEKKITEITEKQEINQLEYIEKKLEKEKRKDEKRKRIINEYKSDYSDSKTHREDYFNFIKNFVIFLESVIGKNININGSDIYLLDDIYVINHDHNGYPLDNKILLNEKENKIIMKKNHPFFNKDVIFYINNRLQIEIYYDAVSLLLLGYKEKNKEYQRSKNTNVYLKINYSILNRLKTLGYEQRILNISEYKKTATEKYKINDDQQIIKYIITEISRERMTNLKNVITDIQKYINRTKFNYNKPFLYTYDMIDEDAFLDKYKDKLMKLKLLDSNKTIFFRDWKTFKYGLSTQNLSSKTINLGLNSDYILSEDISFYDYHGNLILYYIVDELQKLVKMNDDKYIQTTLVFLIIDIIIRTHDEYNKEKIYTNFEIKRFNYMLQNAQYMYDVEEKGHGLDGIEDQVEGFYGEAKDADADVDDQTMEKELDQKEDDREEMDALDVDLDVGEEMDFEIDYEVGINGDG